MERCRFKPSGSAFAMLLTLVLAARAGATAPTAPTEIVIPAGGVATLANATFGDQVVNPGNCPADHLAYGYQLGAGANVQLGAGVGCQPASGATVGPFTTPTQLRVFLSDVSCGDTFDSVGNHALVHASAAGTWTVSIMDSNLCTAGPGRFACAGRAGHRKPQCHGHPDAGDHGVDGPDRQQRHYWRNRRDRYGRGCGWIERAHGRHRRDGVDGRHRSKGAPKQDRAAAVREDREGAPDDEYT